MLCAVIARTTKGRKPGWAPNAYASYARDLDGNKICVYCFKAE